jgi:hypothetical protein
MAASSASPDAQALLASWRVEKDFAKRDILLKQLQDNRIFPGDDQSSWELDAGLYPDLNDPRFLPKLLRKREFQESKQKSVKESIEEGVDRCRSSEDFELSSVQRFVSRVLSPRTPYNSALFYHGVGVGKTCAAITVCESYLEAYPGRKVYIVAPPNIQEGFRRTIFDKEGLRIPKAGANSHRGCTGDIYLSLTNTFEERDSKVIEAKVAKAVKSRYEFFGYTSFYNHIRRILSKLPPANSIPGEQYETLKRGLLRTEFSDRVIIIDEAHNLRDTVEEGSASSASSASSGAEAAASALEDAPQDLSDSKGGKRLTPYLQEVLEVSEGITLVLMTATPMYNSYVEIVFLLNLLLINDKFPRMLIDDIFDTRLEKFKQGGRGLLGKVASTYISFMRGENPLTFPLRLSPLEDRVVAWASSTPKMLPIDPQEGERVVKLPFISASFSPEVEALYYAGAESILSSSEGLGITNMDLLIQGGNWIFPGDPSEDIRSRIRQEGFENTFTKDKKGQLAQYRCVEGVDASWLLEENLPKASAKAAVLLKRVRRGKGVAFVYSRFVPSGALTIALAFEANGYTNATGPPLLADGNQHPDGRQCALCERKERGHSASLEAKGQEGKVQMHAFKPAKYVLLTGSDEISPNNAISINAARSSKNVNGEEVKVVIGSQIAGEGLDLRYVREVFVFDSWYHLNKLEQIIGRGIRNCSHAALEKEKRNCTVSLLVNTYKTKPQVETIDMYSYRTALRKAVTVGNVTRVLKEYAMDCTLNRAAIIVEGLDPIPFLYDSQGNERTQVNINDTPLTPMCDWLDKCQYDCFSSVGADDATGVARADTVGDAGVASAEPLIIDVPLDKQDSSTYDEYTARYQLNTLRKYIQELFGKEEQAFVTFESMQTHFNTIPRPLLASLMSELLHDTKIRLERGSGVEEGHIIYKNGYYLFQPDKIKDTSIPIAIRVASIPIARDQYIPLAIEPAKEEVDVAGIVGEEMSKKISVGDEDSEALWEEALEWADAIRNGRADSVIPAQLLTEVSNMRDSAGILKAQTERLEMILWFYATIKNKPEERGRFADCVLDFFWDEFLTHGTKRELLNIKTSDPVIRKVGKDLFWELEGSTYIRFLNDKNNIEYICVGADSRTSPCSRAVAEVLSKEVGEDPVLKRTLDAGTTGYAYGFVIYNPKKMKFIFKKGTPPTTGGKVGRGSECSISSNITYPRKLLERFGESLRAAKFDDLGLNESEMNRRRIQNSVRICTVCDLALRYMDRAGVAGKRWFYRPLEAKLYRHPLR